MRSLLLLFLGGSTFLLHTTLVRADDCFGPRKPRYTYYTHTYVPVGFINAGAFAPPSDDPLNKVFDAVINAKRANTAYATFTAEMNFNNRVKAMFEKEFKGMIAPNLLDEKPRMENEELLKTLMDIRQSLRDMDDRLKKIEGKQKANETERIGPPAVAPR